MDGILIAKLVIALFMIQVLLGLIAYLTDRKFDFTEGARRGGGGGGLGDGGGFGGPPALI